MTKTLSPLQQALLERIAQGAELWYQPYSAATPSRWWLRQDYRDETIANRRTVHVLMQRSLIVAQERLGKSGPIRFVVKEAEPA